MKAMRRNGYFSIREVLTAVAIMAVVTAAVYRHYISRSNAWKSQDIILGTQQNARIAMELMAEELKTGGGNGTGMESQMFIEYAAGDKITFSRDAGDVNTAYYLLNNTLYRSVSRAQQKGVYASYTATSNQAILDNVEAVIFKYFDDRGNELKPAPLDSTRREAIAGIKVGMKVSTQRPDPVSNDYKTVDIMSDIWRR